MAYNPTNWECGDVVTSERLNKLEEGVADIMSEYVPTEWQCGDVITAEKLNKLEQAVAEASEGGGGSSDFSTVTVTIVGSDAGYASESYSMPVITEEEGVCSMFIEAMDEPQDFTVPLYKGMATFRAGENVIVSGDATYDEVTAVVHIFGDCSIKGYLLK